MSFSDIIGIAGLAVGIIGVVVGIILACCIIFAMYLLAATLRSEEEIKTLK